MKREELLKLEAFFRRRFNMPTISVKVPKGSQLVLLESRGGIHAQETIRELQQQVVQKLASFCL